MNKNEGLHKVDTTKTPSLTYDDGESPQTFDSMAAWLEPAIYFLCGVSFGCALTLVFLTSKI